MSIISGNQEIRIKGREMALVWHEKASRTALQKSSLLHTHTLLVQTHNMITVKEIAEQLSSIIIKLELISLHENLAYSVDLNV